MISAGCKFKNWLNSRLAHLLLVAALVFTTFGALSGAALAQYAVVILDEGAKQVVYTSFKEAEKILAEEQISIQEHDIIEFSGIKDHQGIITIHRASQVTICADGKEQNVWMTDGTIAQALEKADITLSEEDIISVAHTMPIEDDTYVSIKRISTEKVTKLEEIPFETEKIRTPTLKSGKTRVLNKGQNGKKQITLQQKIVDGKITESTILSEKIIEPPVSSKILVGDPAAPVSVLTPEEPIELDENGNPKHYRAKVTGKATAYSSRGKPTKLRPGSVAMNLDEYPRGSKLYIKTPDGSFVYGYSVVKDTGPAVNEGICLVDLFFGSYEESVAFGAKTVDIYIL